MRISDWSSDVCSSDLSAAEPAMQAYAKRIVHVGEAGSGQLAKMVNQIAIAGLVQALSEAVHFAKRAGLDVATVIDAISGGAAQSWQMNNRALTMADRSEEHTSELQSLMRISYSF